MIKIRFTAALLLLSAALIFAGCSGDTKTIPDLPVSDIAAAFDSKIAASADLADCGDDYLINMCGVNPQDVDGYVMKLQVSGTGADSYGIFKLIDETNKEAVESGLNSYIENLRANYENFNYLPEEEGKIKGASVRVCGKYVYFTILSETEKAACDSAFDEMMKGK